jgi:hypothetical protein
MAKENIPHDQVFIVLYLLAVMPSMVGPHVAVTGGRFREQLSGY